MLTSKDIRELRAQGVESIVVTEEAFDTLLDECRIENFVLIEKDEGLVVDATKLYFYGVMVRNKFPLDNQS